MIYIAIWLLTVFDAAATWLGVTRYGIGEGNPVMAWLFGWSVPGTCALVVVLIGALLLFVRKHADRYRWIGWALIGVLAVKIGIAGLHVVWLTMI